LSVFRVKKLVVCEIHFGCLWKQPHVESDIGHLVRVTSSSLGVSPFLVVLVGVVAYISSFGTPVCLHPVPCALQTQNPNLECTDRPPHCSPHHEAWHLQTASRKCRTQLPSRCTHRIDLHVPPAERKSAIVTYVFLNLGPVRSTPPAGRQKLTSSQSSGNPRAARANILVCSAATLGSRASRTILMITVSVRCSRVEFDERNGLLMSIA
jgi:hypothetical protein